MGFNKTSLVNLGLIEERGRRRVVVHRFLQSVTIIFTFYYVLGEDISVDLSDDKHTQCTHSGRAMFIESIPQSGF